PFRPPSCAAASVTMPAASRDRRRARAGTASLGTHDLPRPVRVGLTGRASPRRSRRRLHAPSRPFPAPLMLTEDEAEAVLLGLRYVDQRGDDVLTKAAANAHAKILAVLPQEGQIAATLPMTIPGPKTHGFPENKVPLNALRLAIRTFRRLAIDYVNGEGRQTRRVIWPIQLSFMDNARVVTGWCELRKAFRFFRTDRISSAEIGDRYPARRADLIRDFYVQLSDEHS